MPFALAAWLPSLIMGGGSVVGALFGSRAQGKAAETSAEASERAAEMQLEFGREQLQNLREIYNLDLKLQWPTHRLAGESLGQLARGMGSKLDPSVFDTSEAPPELPSHSLGGPGETGPFGEISGGYELPEEGEGGPSGGWGEPGRIAGAALGGVGGYLLGGKIGRGRREADYLVPHQEELTRRISQIETDIDRRIADGTMTDEDWTAASNAVRSMRDRYYEFTQPYERAGAGGRRTIGGWVDPLLASWGNQTARSAEARGGAPPRAQRQPAQIDQNPFEDPSGNPFEHRAHGGPVRQRGRTLSAMGKRMYKVGEKGREMYVPNQGQPSMVGVGGPEVRSFPEDGYIVPNDELGMNLSPSQNWGGGMNGAMDGGNPFSTRMPTRGRGNLGNPPITLSRMAGGHYGIPGRAEGGPVEGDDDPRNIEQWGWEEGNYGEWHHPETGATGHWASDGTFVNETANKVYDPETGEVNDVEPGQADRVNPAGQRQEGVTAANTIEQWGWEDRGNGDWFNSGTGERGRFLERWKVP